MLQRSNLELRQWCNGVPDFFVVRIAQEPKNKEYMNASLVVGYYSLRINHLGALLRHWQECDSILPAAP